jgi:hypothetical protein
MKKSTYIFICLLLSVEFWHLSAINTILNADVILVLTIAWAMLSFVLYRKSASKNLYKAKYLKLTNWIFVGVFISMFSAAFFWKQSFSQTFIAQRFVYSFILFPALLYAKPAEADIIKAL